MRRFRDREFQRVIAGLFGRRCTADGAGDVNRCAGLDAGSANLAALSQLRFQDFALVQIADRAVVFGQRFVDAPGRFEFVVNRSDQFAIFGVGEALLDELRRDFRCGKECFRGQRDVGRGDAGFRNRRVEHVPEAFGGIDQQLGDDTAGDVIEPFRRPDGAFVNVVMRNQLFIIAMRELGAVANQFGEPVRPGRNRNIEVCELLLAERAKVIVRTADAPFGGAMNGILGFRLAGVKGLNGVGVIMAQDTGRVDRFRPIAGLQLVDGLLIPGCGLFRRAAPIFSATCRTWFLKSLKLTSGAFEPSR